MNNALARVVGTYVQNVIAVEPGTTAAALGLDGVWVPVEDGTVGVGFVYDAETGEFLPPFEPELTGEEPTE